MMLVHQTAFVFSLLMLASTSLAGRLSLCTNWALRFGWLVATCPNDAEPPVQVESALWINQIVAVNEESQLIWSKKGGFDDSCSNWVENGILWGDCVVKGGGRLQTNLDLATYIDNYNGFLISNFTKTPVVPAASSNIPVPMFFMISLWLERTNCSAWNSPFDYYAPTKCNNVEPQGDTIIDNMSYSASINDGYEMTLWSTSDCSGEPLADIGLKDQFKYCNSVPSPVKGVSVRPLFNADYDFSFASGKGFRYGEKCAPSEC